MTRTEAQARTKHFVRELRKDNFAFILIYDMLKEAINDIHLEENNSTPEATKQQCKQIRLEESIAEIQNNPN